MYVECAWCKGTKRVRYFGGGSFLKPGASRANKTHVLYTFRKLETGFRRWNRPPPLYLYERTFSLIPCVSFSSTRRPPSQLVSRL